jgi:hypothetical protein
MIGAPTGPCSPRTNAEFQSRSTSPTRSPKSALWATSDSKFSPNSGSPVSQATWKDCTLVPVSDYSWKREGRICVHADTSNNTAVYPNFLFDPDGDVVPTPVPGTFDMSQLVSQQCDGINYSGQATGIMVASNGDPAKSHHISLGTFFQLSPTRAIGCFHNVVHPLDSKRRLKDVWVSKTCTVTHWEAIITSAKSRAKYFRRANILGDSETERSEILSQLSDTLKVNGLTPSTPLDVVILELPPDFASDPYLKPLPRNKFKTIKKIGVVAYNQREQRREEERAEIYQCTQGIPTYDQEPKYIHHGSKSLSPGILVNYSDHYITYEASLIEGSSGGPLVSLTRPHYFWGVHCWAFSDTDPNQAPKSRNYNVAISFYHPGVLALYERYVLGTLSDGEKAEIIAACYRD